MVSIKQLTIRFSGDSGDGMQLVGQQFTLTAATQGFDVKTKPDFPAEIRAPAGTQSGVSGFDIAIAEVPLYAVDDEVDVLVALNPAALTVSLPNLKEDGLLIINQDSFSPRDWKKAASSPSLLDNVSQQLIEVPINKITKNTLAESNLSHSQVNKTKNFIVLGLALWLFELELEQCCQFIDEKFNANLDIAEANTLALKAGFNFGVTLELSRHNFKLTKTRQSPGHYRQITGIEAMGLACASLCYKTQTSMLVSGYPITPASALLHEAAKLSEFGVRLFQAEDEISAVCSALGAAFGGHLALTCTSGPGLDLKAEGLSLAVMAELPLVVVDVQRAGPSTGLPTKTEQSDLLMALYGRHGESPLPVIAASTPSDCFTRLIEAFRLAIKYMTPVILLIDSNLANGAEPWQIPAVDELDIEPITYNQKDNPYDRLESLSRPWIKPGTPDLMHQIGGLEKQGVKGKVSYDADNHQAMVTMRQSKIANVANDYPTLEIEGDVAAKTVIISWGSTYGGVKTAVEACNIQGCPIAMVHLHHLNPLPQDLSLHLKKYSKVIVAELNQGQLLKVIRGEYLVDAKGITQCNGKSFNVKQLTLQLTQEATNVCV